MKNLKEETLADIKQVGKTLDDVDYCNIYKEDTWYNDKKVLCSVCLDIDSLDLNYDDYYGTQEIYGFIVFKDGTWLDRREYDGSEWWEYQSKPERPA